MSPIQVPEAAIEAATAAFERVPDGAQFRERLTQLPQYGGVVVPPSELSREMLQAALPSIQEAVEAEVGVRLLAEAERLEAIPVGETPGDMTGRALRLAKAQALRNFSSALPSTSTKGSHGD